MGQTPPPVNKGMLRIGLLAGIVLSLVGVGSFLAIWFGMTSIAQTPRLLMAVCIPPLIIAVLLGGFVLFARRNLPQDD